MDCFKKLLIAVALVVLAGQVDAAEHPWPWKSVHLSLLTPNAVEYIHKAKRKGQTELAKFVEKYTPPLRVCKVFDVAKEKTKKEGVVEGFCCKGNDITRIINAERLRQCIAVHGLDTLDVARKYVYPINGELYVFAQYVEPGERKSKKEASMISLQETKDLATLVEETGYRDLSLQNIVRDSGGKLVIIDTEDRSFLNHSSSKENWCPLAYLENLKAHTASICQYTDHRFLLQDDAKQWLDDRIAIHKQKRVEPYGELWPLPFSDRFDEAIGIDFEYLKKELGF